MEAPVGTGFPAIVVRPIVHAGVDRARNTVLAWYLAVAIAGMLIGFGFRAGALMAATLVTGVLAFVFQTHDHGFGWSPVWVTLESAILLQLGYLAGLAIAALWRHLRG